MTASPHTLKSFLRALGTERDGRLLMRRLRWPDGDCCPQCDDVRVRQLFSGLNGKARSRILYHCLNCGYQFSETSGTVFHDSHVEIRDWLLAIYLMGSIEKGIRVAQLEKFIGVNHETAVSMAKRIREAARRDPKFIQRCLQLPHQAVADMDSATPNKHRHPTLHSVVCTFSTEALTREHVARIRWPSGPTCLKCQKTDVRKVKSKCRRNRHLYWCLGCKKQFSVTSGDHVLRGIRNLSEWFLALYLVESSPRGIPPKLLERLLGINYRTAVKLIGWFRGKEDRRKRLFESYIGYNDRAEYEAARQAIKKERALIKEQKGNASIGPTTPTGYRPQEVASKKAKALPPPEPPMRSEPTPEFFVFKRRGIDK
jgi:transposase-like protein